MFTNVGWSDNCSLLQHLTTDWPIVNPFSRGLMAIIRLHHVRIWYYRRAISEFTLLKCSIFVAIRPQFDDDLHSSRWRLQIRSSFDLSGRFGGLTPAPGWRWPPHWWLKIFVWGVGFYPSPPSPDPASQFLITCAALAFTIRLWQRLYPAFEIRE